MVVLGRGAVCYERGTPVGFRAEGLGDMPGSYDSFGQRPPNAPSGILQEKSFDLKLPGNEIYCTNALLLLMKIMLCSKVRCHFFKK